MKVVHLLSGDLWAGAAVSAYHLMRGLSERADVAPRAVVLNAGTAAERLQAAGLLAAVEPEDGRGFAALARAIRARVRDADLVHTHGYKEDLLAALSGRPWIATQHGRPEPQRGAAALRFRGYLALDRALQRFGARRVVAVSPEVGRWLGSRIGRARVAHCGNGLVDPAACVPGMAWSERPLRVGVLARLYPVKATHVAIQAVAGCPGLELEIVGDGPESSRLRALAAELGVQRRVSFTGFDPDPSRRIASWRLLLVPSLHEGHPMSVLEALAWSTPVLAGPLPGVGAMLGERGGWQLPDRDPQRWAVAIRQILEDPESGEHASAAARARFVEAFDARRAADRMTRIYRAALASGDPEELSLFAGTA